MTQTHDDDLRPRIACFHGGGSSAAIYEVQCSFLAPLLEQDFRFEFFEGPFECSAGPGVLPAFSGFEPYKSWVFRGRSSPEQSEGKEWTEKDGLDRVWRMMEERRGKGEWVGVMGFSEGSRIASGLLLDQQRREEKRLSPAVDSIRLRFGVMCMGGGVPMGLDGTVSKTTDIIRTPTLHMHGLKDQFLTLGRDQYKRYFDPSTASLFEVDYHHAMPWLQAESVELAERILSLYQGTL